MAGCRSVATTTLAAFLAASIPFVTASTARAEGPSAADRAEATALFKEAKAQMDAGDLAHACPKFEESQRLDPGSGTVLNLALCYEKAGRSATAWSTYNEALAYARRDGRPDRIDFAQKHIALLEPKLSKLVVIVRPEVAVEGLRVVRDGGEVRSAAWGEPIPVDPGDHHVEATAPKKRPWAADVHIEAGGATQTIEVPPLPDAPPSRDDATPAPVAPPKRSTMTAGIVVGALGVAWIGAGVFFGARAFSKRHDSDLECVSGCTARGASLNDDAKHAADTSTVSFAIGAVGVAIGTWLFFRHDEPSPMVVAPTAARDGGGVALAGHF